MPTTDEVAAVVGYYPDTEEVSDVLASPELSIEEDGVVLSTGGYSIGSMI